MMACETELRFLSRERDGDLMVNAVHLLASEFVAKPELRDAWIERMLSVMQADFSDVKQGLAQRGGSVMVGIHAGQVVSVFTMKYYARELIWPQEYFVTSADGERLAVSCFGEIAEAHFGGLSSNVVGEYDLSFVLPGLRGQNLHQEATVRGFQRMSEQLRGSRAIAFALIRSPLAGRDGSIGRKLRRLLETRVCSSEIVHQRFTPDNSIAVCEIPVLLGESVELSIHPAAAAAAHMAEKLGARRVGYHGQNLSALYMTCHDT
jgi:hypothetical protein